MTPRASQLHTRVEGAGVLLPGTRGAPGGVIVGRLAQTLHIGVDLTRREDPVA